MWFSDVIAERYRISVRGSLNSTGFMPFSYLSGQLQSLKSASLKGSEIHRDFSKRTIGRAMISTIPDTSQLAIVPSQPYRTFTFRIEYRSPLSLLLIDRRPSLHFANCLFFPSGTDYRCAVLSLSICLSPPDRTHLCCLCLCLCRLSSALVPHSVNVNSMHVPLPEPRLVNHASHAHQYTSTSPSTPIHSRPLLSAGTTGTYPA